jgi:hypothetical protein
MDGQPNQTPAGTDASVALVLGNLLIGGMPGAGKSYLLNLLTVHAALSADGPLPVGDDPKEGGRGDADPGR